MCLWELRQENCLRPLVWATGEILLFKKKKTETSELTGALTFQLPKPVPSLSIAFQVIAYTPVCPGGSSNCVYLCLSWGASGVT